MKWIKKIATTPLTQLAKVIDSLSPQVNDRTNAPSIRAVREALDISWDQVYPVGAIYMTVNADDPSTLFGGTWQRIKDRFLLASGDAYANGSTGGSATHTPTGSVGSHTLTVNEIPSHTHILDAVAKASNSDAIPHGTGSTSVQAGSASIYQPTGSSSSLDVTGTATGTGGGLGHNHPFAGVAQNTMPPYLTVNVWTRVA